MTATTIDASGEPEGPDGPPAGPGARATVRLRSRLRARDLLSVGTIGLRIKRARTALTALGIAIGIAAMVSVIGISASSRADLIAELDRLGTNLLQVSPGSSMFGDDAELPTTAPDMVRRVGGVEDAAATRIVPDTTVRRTDHIPEVDTSGISVVATEPNLLATVGGSVARGTFLNEATATQPAVVLGSTAAERLGITDVDLRDSAASDDEGVAVYLGDRWFTVVGILDPVPLAPDIDRSVLIGYDVARDLFGIEESASAVRARTDPDVTDLVADVLPRTANPEAPEEIDITRPSDALEARAQVDESLTALLLGLGAVALLVAGVGIANVMVIAVLERRSEIGVRRALGATRRHILAQFLTESMLLSFLGGAAGVLAGVVITRLYAGSRGWAFSVPPAALVGGVAVSLAVGAVAGLYPAVRASRLAPAEAVRSE